MFLIIFTFSKKNRTINSFRIAENIALEIATLQDIEGFFITTRIIFSL